MVLLFASPEQRGGGDLDLDDNWHGPERNEDGQHGGSAGPMPAEYPEVAHRTIGRWAGDRIAIVGDYAENSDLAPEHEASKIYGLCREDSEEGGYRDVTTDVLTVLAHELHQDKWLRKLLTQKI